MKLLNHALRSFFLGGFLTSGPLMLVDNFFHQGLVVDTFFWWFVWSAIGFLATWRE